MRARVFLGDGEVKELECLSVEPYYHLATSLVHVKAADGKDVVTSMPVIFDGVQVGDFDLDGTELFDVTMSFCTGAGVRKFSWVGAEGEILWGNILTFWHDGAWHSVSGPVIIENSRPKGQE